MCGFSTYETGAGYPRFLDGGRDMASPLQAIQRGANCVGARPCLARHRPFRHRRAPESPMCLNLDIHEREEIVERFGYCSTSYFSPLRWL